jgi:hypothetical protein
MNIRRRKQIVALALHFLINEDYEHMLEMYAPNGEEVDANVSVEPEYTELELSGKVIFGPTVKELEAMQEKGRNGNVRTRQILLLGLHLIHDCVDDLQEMYAYCGEVERFAETHISLDDINFRRPMQEEIQEVINDVDLCVKSLPAMKGFTVGWDIYDLENGEDLMEDQGSRYVHIDTVFFDHTCDRQYVRNSLVGHDGYNPTIALVC